MIDCFSVLFRHLQCMCLSLWKTEGCGKQGQLWGRAGDGRNAKVGLVIQLSNISNCLASLRPRVKSPVQKKKCQSPQVTSISFLKVGFCTRPESNHRSQSESQYSNEDYKDFSLGSWRLKPSLLLTQPGQVNSLLQEPWKQAALPGKQVTASPVHGSYIIEFTISRCIIHWVLVYSLKLLDFCRMHERTRSLKVIWL